MRYADCHLHSLHSFDGDKNATVQNIIAAAKEKEALLAWTHKVVDGLQ